MARGLVIRTSQMETFQQDTRFRWIEQKLEQAYPDQVRAMDRARLRQTVREGIAQAERAGLETDQDIFRYVHVGFALGQDLASLEWAGQILGKGSPVCLDELEAETERRLASGELSRYKEAASGGR
jgi:hypothetical protein